MIRSGTYTCCICKGEFPYSWDEEEAKAEYEREFPGFPWELRSPPICDDCFNKILPAIKAAENN